MNMKYFGDSYDIVKKFLIHSLAPNSEWVAFPMFTHAVDKKSIKEFEKFLGVRVIESDIVTKPSDRVDYLAYSSNHQYIFIDPDTGIKISKLNNSKEHIFGEELIKLCKNNKERLLLVFDQSFIRGKFDESIKEKLLYFRKQGIYCFYYRSHACFLVLSASNSVRKNAYDHLLRSGLPSDRLIAGVKP